MIPLQFDNRLVRELPGDAETGNGRRQVHGALYSRVLPTPVGQPRIAAWSREMLHALGLPESVAQTPRFAAVFAGNESLDGMEPYSANYGGHQFGTWAGQLGDGRAITLGEVATSSGARWELQLKGAGPTPYSRSADGRAVLRSSVREFLCSEAMHHLGIPTTRALCLVVTGDSVVRDMFYDGRAQEEPGAIVCRVAPSFIRFGNFELPASRGDTPLLRRLVDFTIRRDFPELDAPPDGELDETHYAEWFGSVCERTAVMIAHWQRVGFVHGVMNTDNMSILGLTLDYGPYGWIDHFDPDWTPNTTDAAGRRYRFGHQPQIAYWNLGRLAGALLTLFTSHDPLHAGLARFASVFEDTDRRFTAAKLGLSSLLPGDAALVRGLRDVLTSCELDMTLFYRTLAGLDLAAPSPATFEPAFYDEAKRRAGEPMLADWLAGYAALARERGLAPDVRSRVMNAANPLYVCRNYLAQEAIDRAQAGDYTGIAELLEVLRRPYDEQPGRDAYRARRPDWARDRAGCSMLSCSS